MSFSSFVSEHYNQEIDTTKRVGTVYLIHFEVPFWHANHYVGFTTGHIDKRINDHKQNIGAKLLRALNLAKRNWKVVRLWPNVKSGYERYLKSLKKSSTFCPVCRGEIDYKTLQNPTNPNYNNLHELI